MIIEFEKKFLSELYHIGLHIDKTYTYHRIAIERYIMRVDALMATDNLDQLKALKSWDFQMMDDEECYSVRLDYVYRLMFRVNKSVCTLMDITDQN